MRFLYRYTSVDAVFNLTNVNCWFLIQIKEAICLEEKITEFDTNGLLAEFSQILK
ncbi:MAG: hypothetical protein ACTS85_02880 [Arsenophonus sp. NC-PG7-MAG3]